MKKLFYCLCVLSVVLTWSFAPDAPGKGIIKGKVIYPGEGIPTDMVLVAQSVETGEKFKKQLVKRNKELGFVAEMNFSMRLKPGSYYLYVSSNYGPVKGVKAYYTQFITCGMHVNCKSHKKIPVQVEARKKIEGLIIGDWYDQQTIQ